MCDCRTLISFGSWSHGGIAHTTGVMPWVDIGSLGRTDQVSKEVELPCTQEQQGCMELRLGTEFEPAESLQVRIRGRPTREMLWWLSPTDCLRRKK